MCDKVRSTGNKSSAFIPVRCSKEQQRKRSFRRTRSVRRKVRFQVVRNKRKASEAFDNA